MAKVITLTYESKDYTLEYNRSSVFKLENKGFNVTTFKDDIKEKPLQTISLLFEGAFYMHHPDISKDVVDTLFSAVFSLEDESLINRLVEMYGDTINTLYDEENAKKVKVKANW